MGYFSLADKPPYDDTSVKAEISALQTGKVDKADGMGLISDVEKTRLSTVTNYDDTSVKADISALQAGKVDKADGMGLISDAEKERLVTVSNYDDTEIKADIAECMAKNASVATLKKRFYYAEDDALTKYGGNIIVWQESNKTPGGGSATTPRQIDKDDISSHGFHISGKNVIVQQTAKIDVSLSYNYGRSKLLFKEKVHITDKCILSMAFKAGTNCGIEIQLIQSDVVPTSTANYETIMNTTPAWSCGYDDVYYKSAYYLDGVSEGDYYIVLAGSYKKGYNTDYISRLDLYEMNIDVRLFL
jgi:hypothetical protein